MVEPQVERVLDPLMITYRRATPPEHLLWTLHELKIKFQS